MISKRFSILLTGTVLICVLMLSCASNKKFTNWEQKTVAAVYSGGHKWDVSLTLYTDSTFVYIIRDDILGIPRKKNGAYLMTDTSITLYRWESKVMRNKYDIDAQTFRIRDNKVLMFDKATERSKDSSFYRAYYTLTLDK